MNSDIKMILRDCTCKENYVFQTPNPQNMFSSPINYLATGR